MRSRCGFVARTVSFHVLLLLFALPALTSAQETRATITGTVTDTQGPSSPASPSRASTPTRTCDRGREHEADVAYTVHQAAAGAGPSSAALPGFKTFVRDGVVLRTAETGTINMSLDGRRGGRDHHRQRGDLSGIESNESTIAQTMENKRISELPLERAPGLHAAAAHRGHALHPDAVRRPGFSGTRAWDVNGSLSIHGSRIGNNEFLIDGGAIAGTGGWSVRAAGGRHRGVQGAERQHRRLVRPHQRRRREPDAALGHQPAARLGHRAPTAAPPSTRTGPEHPQQHLATRATSTQRRNHAERADPPQDKTFFMVGYQGFYENIPFPVTRTIPPSSSCTGTSRRRPPRTGSSIHIYDPAHDAARTPPARTFIRDPFRRQHHLRQNRFHPISRTLLQYFPRAERRAEQPRRAATTSSTHRASDATATTRI